MNFVGDFVDLEDGAIPYKQKNTEGLNKLCAIYITDFINHANIDKEKILNIGVNISVRLRLGYSFILFL